MKRKDCQSLAAMKLMHTHIIIHKSNVPTKLIFIKYCWHWNIHLVHRNQLNSYLQLIKLHKKELLCKLLQFLGIQVYIHTLMHANGTTCCPQRSAICTACTWHAVPTFPADEAWYWPKCVLHTGWGATSCTLGDHILGDLQTCRTKVIL